MEGERERSEGGRDGWIWWSTHTHTHSHSPPCHSPNQLINPVSISKYIRGKCIGRACWKCPFGKSKSNIAPVHPLTPFPSAHPVCLCGCHCCWRLGQVNPWTQGNGKELWYPVNLPFICSHYPLGQNPAIHDHGWNHGHKRWSHHPKVHCPRQCGC